jgi:hypothetical protein
MLHLESDSNYIFKNSTFEQKFNFIVQKDIFFFKKY